MAVPVTDTDTGSSSSINMASAPSDAELRVKIKELIPTVDVNTMGVKAFVKLLSAECDGIDLKPRKDFIKQALTEIISEENEDDQDEVDDDEDEEHDDAEVSSGKGAGGLAQRKEISDKLATFLGKGKTMARTEIVRELWNYIRENNLQNPSNKREIILDDAMRKVFECPKFTMFTMNKYIGAHIHPFKAVDLTSTPKRTSSKRKASKARGSSTAKKARKVGTQPPYRLSEELQAIVGTDILPRPQVVSKLWEYIKAHGLQNENDRREILCDEKLKKVLKKDKISMFQMNVPIGAHLLEKLDKSEYQHDEVDKDEEEIGSAGDGDEEDGE
jgi:upstream activation factor subunit UAF30